jgi:hypothetical protein
MLAAHSARKQDAEEKIMTKLNWDKARKNRWPTEEQERFQKKMRRYIKDVKKAAAKSNKTEWTDEKQKGLSEKIARYKAKRDAGLI